MKAHLILRDLRIFVIWFFLLTLTIYSASSFGGYKPQERKNSYGACFTQIESQLKKPGTLSISVAFGYSDDVDDGLDLVNDQFTRKNLDSLLTAQCKYSRQGFCGFTRGKENPNKPVEYTRMIELNQGQSLLIEVNVMNSSFSIFNSSNKSKYRSEQSIQTQEAQEFYAWSVSNADIVFYEGHSRDGGGPDFAPPRQASNGHVDYPWYRKNKPGLKFLLNAIDQSNQPPQIFGLFSCASQGHFRKSLSSHMPNTTTILSTRVVEAQYTKMALFLSLESVLNFECSKDLSSRVQKTSFVVNSSL